MATPTTDPFGDQNKRWLIALEVEKTWNKKREDIEERIEERRHTWARLLDVLDGVISFSASKRILDIGAEATSIFLVLREGEKYAVDPLFGYLFDRHPFLKEIDEYRDVHFVSSSLDDLSSVQGFDVIFCLAMLDHIGDLETTISKIDELLKPSGYVVVMVDCHADPLVNRIMNSFDVELYHPHHFTEGDIVRLFSKYRQRIHSQVFEFYSGCAVARQTEKVNILRVDKLARRGWRLLKEWRKSSDVPFLLKFLVCYGSAYSISLVRRKDKPIHPLKKPHLFVFQKQ